MWFNTPVLMSAKKEQKGQVSRRDIKTRANASTVMRGDWPKVLISSKRNTKQHFLAFGSLVSSCGFHNKTIGMRICCRLWSLNARAEQEGPVFGRTGNRSSIQKPCDGCDSQWRSANKRRCDSVGQGFGFIRDSTAPRGYASCPIARKATDIPMSGPVVKNHSCEKKTGKYFSTRNTTCRSMFRACQLGLGGKYVVNVCVAGPNARGFYAIASKHKKQA